MMRIRLRACVIALIKLNKEKGKKKARDVEKGATASSCADQHRIEAARSSSSSSSNHPLNLRIIKECPNRKKLARNDLLQQIERRNKKLGQERERGEKIKGGQPHRVPYSAKTTN